MKKVKEFATGIVFCLFELVVGILLLIDPVGLTSWVIRIAGVVLVVVGVIDIVKYFTAGVKEAALGQTLGKGILFILGGCFCVFKTEWFLVTFPVLTILYGVVILMSGAGKIQMTVDMLRQKNKKWFWAAISAVVSIVCAVVILSSPFSSTVALWIFTGISLIVESVLDLLTLIFGKKSEKAAEGVDA